VACVRSASAAAVSKAGRGPFAGLPREAAIVSAVSFTVALGYGIVAPGIPALRNALRSQRYVSHRPGPATCSGIADRRLEWPLSWQSVTVAGWRRVKHLVGAGTAGAG